MVQIQQPEHRAKDEVASQARARAFARFAFARLIDLTNQLRYKLARLKRFNSSEMMEITISRGDVTK